MPATKSLLCSGPAVAGGGSRSTLVLVLLRPGLAVVGAGSRSPMVLVLFRHGPKWDQRCRRSECFGATSRNGQERSRQHTSVAGEGHHYSGSYPEDPSGIVVEV